MFTPHPTPPLQLEFPEQQSQRTHLPLGHQEGGSGEKTGGVGGWWKGPEATSGLPWSQVL